ncbi:MAG: orotate phosphoribosyltransferase [Alphaproteobacteria bacterium]
MDQTQVMDEFRAADALLEGHFILSSGMRSSVYLQCARVLMDPARAGRLCAALAEKVRATISDPIDIAVAPAMGGVIVGYELARQLGVPGIFTERVEGEFAFRRGFSIEPGAKVIMVEDVVTTGLSSRECIAAITKAGGEVVAAASLVNRSGGQADVGVPLISLLEIDAPIYKPEDVPAALAAIEAVKPGSRGLKS